jgi:hypothetical protein
MNVQESMPGRWSRKGREMAQPQKTELNKLKSSYMTGTNNSLLPDNDNDIILTDRTNNTQINGETSRPRDPKPPPIFVYGVTNYRHDSTYICNY